jgi:hypothetical protein
MNNICALFACFISETPERISMRLDVGNPNLKTVDLYLFNISIT